MAFNRTNLQPFTSFHLFSRIGLCLLLTVLYVSYPQTIRAVDASISARVLLVDPQVEAKGTDVQHIVESYMPTAQPSFTPHPTPSASLAGSIEQVVDQPAVIFASNSATVQKSATQSAETGAQTASPAARISTATASARLHSSTEVNTTIVGQEMSVVVVNSTEPSQRIEVATPVSQIATESAMTATPAAFIHVVNEAEISHQFTQTSNTGKNTTINSEATSSAQTAEVHTEDASTQASIVTIANTTVIGNCGYFAIVNVFAPISKELVLPNERDVWKCADEVSDATTMHVSISNQATVQNKVQSTTNTGNNQTSGLDNSVMKTGSASSETYRAENVNITKIQNDWMLVRVQNAEYLQGQLDLPNLTTVLIGNTLYAYRNLTPQSRGAVESSQQQMIVVKNTANVFHSLVQRSETGANVLNGIDKSAVDTGDARTRAVFVSYLNTTVIGSRWYWAEINLFAPVSGTIRFAEPKAKSVRAQQDIHGSSAVVVENADQPNQVVIYPQSVHVLEPRVQTLPEFHPLNQEAFRSRQTPSNVPGSQVLGTATEIVQSAAPTAQARSGQETSRVSFCVANLWLCQGFRAVFWGGLAGTTGIRGYQRWRRRLMPDKY